MARKPGRSKKFQPLPRSRSRRRRLRGVVDTSVLVAGISGFRRPVPDPDDASATLLRQWIDRRSFTWLVSRDILDEYRKTRSAHASKC